MSGRGGRDRFRRYSPPSQPPSSSSGRFSDKSRPVNPPSRHLWVGNLSGHLTESVLADHFLQFGDLESLAFQPGRSYAFVNYRRDEDAIAAMNSLQGFSVDGAALRIEFAKADKMPPTTRDDNYLNRRDEPRSTNRNSPFSQRDSRINHGDPDALLPEDSRESDNTSEAPSKVLWVGYPTFLKIDETALRKAFSPFGEIEKISAFQGRNYAFVRFRSMMSACKAKETLQGKLFGTPRVHICFARSESGLSNNGRQMSRIDSPNKFRSTGRAGSSDDLQTNRNFRDLAENGSSYFPPDLDYRDPDALNFGRNDPSRSGSNASFEQRRMHDVGREMGPSGEHRGYHNAPEFQEFSPPKFPKRSHFPEDPWDLPEDPHLYSAAKRLRNAPPAENELPEYRFSDADRNKPSFRRDIPLLDEAEPLGPRRISDHSVNVNRSFVERSDRLMPPLDSFHSASGAFSASLLDQKRTTPDLPHSSRSREWKWEGTLAKGGNAICRARCLPVGKVLDMKLPEFLDCTARTSLDMLAKHYYQATGTWVVFFVPHSDADINYYNEFMNYLGEKKRAAVSKLDDKNTLFLVPPSDFSEKVLKVPGKLSISGVILRLEPPTSTVHSLPPHIQERKDLNTMPFHNDMLYSRSDPPSGAAFPPGFPKASALSSRLSGYDHQRMPDYADDGHDYLSNHRPTSLQPNLMTQEYNSGFHRSGQDANISGNYNSNRATALSIADESKPPASLSSFGALQPDQLAQLASSLLGQQQRQPGSSSGGSERLYTPTAQANQPSGFSGLPQFQQPQPHQHQQSQQHQQHQQPQQHQQQLGSNTVPAQGSQEDEADPQKRLQATLQLAAALLQQIQQGK